MNDDDAQIIHEMGPNAFIEAHADAYDAIVPGLGEALRIAWRATFPLVGYAIAACSGAESEFEFYQ